jgi:hypothetical protein
VRECRLADARNVLDQQVAARQQACETEPQLQLLAEDDLVERRDRAIDELERAGVRREGGAHHRRLHHEPPCAAPPRRSR